MNDFNYSPCILKLERHLVITNTFPRLKICIEMKRMGKIILLMTFCNTFKLSILLSILKMILYYSLKTIILEFLKDFIIAKVMISSENYLSKAKFSNSSIFPNGMLRNLSLL